MSRVVGAAHLPLMLQQNEIMVDAARTRAQIAAQRQLQREQIQSENQKMVVGLLQRQYEMAQARQAQAQQIAARRWEVNQEISARRETAEFEANARAESDARIDTNARARLQQARDWQLYDKTVEETGMSPGDVLQWSVQRGFAQDTGYQALKQEKQQKDFRLKLEQAREEALTLHRDELSFEDQKTQKYLKDIEERLDQERRSGKHTDVQMQALEDAYTQAEFDVLTRGKWRGRMPASQPNVVYHPVTKEAIGERDATGRIQYYNRGQKNDRQAKEDDFEIPTLEEVDEMVKYLRKAGGAYNYVKDGKTVVNEDAIKTQPVTPAERETVRRQMIDERANTAALARRSRRLIKYKSLGFSQADAEAMVDEELADEAATEKGRIAAQRAERRKRSAEISLVTGRPVPETQPAPAAAGGRRAKLQAIINNPDESEERRQKAREYLSTLGG